jgi:hypothetical protein
MKTAITQLVSGFVLAITLMSPVQAWEPLVLYDDFNSHLINPDKWFGTSANFYSTEGARLSLFRQLQILNRAYGNPSPVPGEAVAAQGLDFIDPDSVTAIKTSIRVLAYQLMGCGDSDLTSRVRARIVGSFFNTTDNPEPGSNLNDLYAQIRVQRNAGSTDASNILRVYADIGLCKTTNCSGPGGWEEIDSTELGTVRLGQKVTLYLAWDEANEYFTVQRDNETEVLSYKGQVQAKSLPSASFKRLQVTQSLANCTTQPRPNGFMSAFFDNVYVNASALETQ